MSSDSVAPDNAPSVDDVHDDSYEPMTYNVNATQTCSDQLGVEVLIVKFMQSYISKEAYDSLLHLLGEGNKPNPPEETVGEKESGAEESTDIKSDSQSDSAPDEEEEAEAEEETEGVRDTTQPRRWKTAPRSAAAAAAAGMRQRSRKAEAEHPAKGEKKSPPQGADKGLPSPQARANDTKLLRNLHHAYIMDRLGPESLASQSLYPAQPWVVYWTLHAADVLGITEDLFAAIPRRDIAQFLFSCLKADFTDFNPSKTGPTTRAEKSGAHVDPEGMDAVNLQTDAPLSHENDESESRELNYYYVKGVRVPIFTSPDACVGFAGGPQGHQPHLAPSHAAVCAMCILDVPEYLQAIPRAAFKRWLLSLRKEDGSFRMHSGGEADMRSSYCASVVVTLLQLDEEILLQKVPQPHTRQFFDDDVDESSVSEGNANESARNAEERLRSEKVLTEATAQFVARSQTVEGGHACNPQSCEAHGAYTCCGLAALLLMKAPHLCQFASLRHWLCSRQMPMEGGFNGRTNKLVDSCYSHWVGSAHVLLRAAEVYCKLLGYTFHSGLGDVKPLRAREMLLLDHAQLIDAPAIATCTTQEGAWESAEREWQEKQKAVKDFLRDESTTASGSSVGSSTSPLRWRHPFADDEAGDYYFNQRRLQVYVLRCCQNNKLGGLMDKPGFPNDSYHTCYSLSGVSSAQNSQYANYASFARDAAAANTNNVSREDDEDTKSGAAEPHSTVEDEFQPNAYLKAAWQQGYLPSSSKQEQFGLVLGVEGVSPASLESILRSTNPIFNIHRSHVVTALKAFGYKTFL